MPGKLRLGLTDRLRDALLGTCGDHGTFDPVVITPHLQGVVGDEELRMASRFLAWVISQRKKFGHGNIETMWTSLFNTEGKS